METWVTAGNQLGRVASVVPARTFLRTLNLVLKTARLYGPEHERTLALIESALQELDSAQKSTGASGVLLGFSESQVLIDGIPVEASPADRNLSALLSTAGVASIYFSKVTTRDDLLQLAKVFALSGTKAGQLISQLKLVLGTSKEAPIRVNEVRFVATDSSNADARMAAELAARALGPQAEKLEPWLRDPQKLLQLIAVAEGAQGHPCAAPGAAASSASTTGMPVPSRPGLEPSEADVLNILQMLARLTQTGDPSTEITTTGGFREQVGQLSPGAQLTLTQALQSLASTAMLRPDTPLLLQLAEHMAVRFALERFESGDVRINAVVAMMDRMKREIRELRRVLNVHEEKMANAGLEVESYADILDRQFWAGLPDHAKLKVLLSPDAWAIPARNIRQYVEDLWERGERETAEEILSNYATCIHSEDTEARRKAAVGITDLATLYSRFGNDLLRDAVASLGERLRQEGEPELQNLLSAGFARFCHEASVRRDYCALREGLVSMESLERDQPQIAASVWPRIRVVDRLPSFIDEAVKLAEIPTGLVEVLRRMPHAVIEQMASRSNRTTRRSECERLVKLAGTLGDEAGNVLRRTLSQRPASEAVAVIALLSRIDAGVVEEMLPTRIRQWDRIYHDQAVRQLAVGGAPERGRILVKLLEAIDESVLPEAIDEIGFSDDRSLTPPLIRIAEGTTRQATDPYLRVKAIEALGRLREEKAGPLLRPLVEEKKLWQWRYPHELRITCAQTLRKIDPDWANRFLPESGLTQSELTLAPLDASPANQWLRQRRYERISLPKRLGGIVDTAQGACPIQVGQLSLGGGVGICKRHLRPGTVTRVELRTGMRTIEAQVRVREARPQQLSFELVRIDLENRARLRKPLAGLQTAAI
jgi:hypothetical protein